MPATQEVHDAARLTHSASGRRWAGVWYGVRMSDRPLALAAPLWGSSREPRWGARPTCRAPTGLQSGEGPAPEAARWRRVP